MFSIHFVLLIISPNVSLINYLPYTEVDEKHLEGKRERYKTDINVTYLTSQ